MLIKILEEIVNETVSDNSKMYDELLSIRADLILAAQKIYNDWEQDEEGYDEMYGSGGICDDIADAMCGIVSEKTDYGCFSLYNEYDCHTSIFVYDSENKTIYNVDIPPYVYESGGGYDWKKLKDVRFKIQHVSITEEDYENYFDENDELIEF